MAETTKHAITITTTGLDNLSVAELHNLLIKVTRTVVANMSVEQQIELLLDPDAAGPTTPSWDFESTVSWEDLALAREMQDAKWPVDEDR
jgi:hypothetical protein